LKKAKLGDTLTDGKLYWILTDDKFDSYIKIASQVTKHGKSLKNGVELWSTGVERFAVIPNLRILNEAK